MKTLMTYVQMGMAIAGEALVGVSFASTVRLRNIMI